MITCSKCGCEVNEGKFCEKCGAPLSVAKNFNVCPNCGAQVNGGKFCEKCGAQLSISSSTNNGMMGSIFDKIGTKVNKAASDILAVKSDYSNNVILYNANKIPNIQEKTIKVLNNEYAFFSTGGGFAKYSETFTTTASNYLCFFIRRDTEIGNAFSLSFDSKIKRIDDDTIKVVLNYDYILSVDPDKFFAAAMEINQNTWTFLDINSLIFKNLNNMILDLIKEKLSSEGELDLSNYSNQIKMYDEDIKALIDREIEKYGLKVKIFKNQNIIINTEEVNKVLIKNLYK